MDSSDLSAQVELFLLEVEGVCDNLTFKVTAKGNLDCSSCLKVLWHKVGEGSPWTLGLVADVVSVFIDADTTRLSAFRSGILRQVLRLKGLNNVIVLLGTQNLTPESERAGLSLSSKGLDRFLKNER